MSYCVNPSCTQPKNPAKTQICQACGSKLLLRDRYQILGILGKGGFGATFGAIDLSLPGQPSCVVKQLRPSTDDPNIYTMAKQLFEREAQTLGRIGNHPQIPRLLDYFEEHQEFYLVQEYVKGHNLHQEVKRNGPFSEAGVRQFLSELLPIVQYIHAQQVIHRDIKPANLIRRDEDRKLVLIDFGAVKNQVNSVVANTSAHTTFTAFAVGTVGFAPPEQMAMRPVYASDIYAIGVTCIYLLTGKSPKNLESDPSSGEILWEKAVSVSESFANVLKTTLEVSVRHRYKSAEEVLDALDLVPYAESLAQSLIAPPTVSNPPDKASNHSPRFQSVNHGTDSQVSSSIHSKLPMGNRSRRQTPPNPPIVESSQTPNGMGFQLANSPAPGRNGTRNAEQPLLKKTPKLDAKALLEAYNWGKRDFAQQELNHLNLQKANLSGINFHQSKLAKVNLQGADLSNADFGRANLSQAVLKNANLTKAYLSYADLEGADLRGADLSFAHLKYANLRDANLCGANLANAHVTEEQLAHAKTNWMTVMPSGKRGFR